MNVILLIGCPGSGKSTIAEKHFASYVRISQDVLGSRQACVEAMKEALRQNKDVLVDLCNMTKSQRDTWIHLALQYGASSVSAIVLTVDEEECVARIHARKNHETIKSEMSVDRKREIVYSFNKSFEQPMLSEGFTSILFIRN